MLEAPSRRRRRKRRTSRRWLLVVLALLAVFLLGIALGEALNDSPKRGDVVTSIRTLSPLPQQPPTRTVTVTVTEQP